MNRSLSYILPMLDWWDRKFLMNRQFVGCFIGDKDRPEYTNCIFLLYQFSGDTNYLKFEQKLKESEYFVQSYEPDKYHTIFVFDVPANHQINYDTYKESKYSKLSESYKQQILKFHEGAEKLKAVLYKHESQFEEIEREINEDLPRSSWVSIPRDQEAAEAINENDEYYSSIYNVTDTIENNKEFL